MFTAATILPASCHAAAKPIAVACCIDVLLRVLYRQKLLPASSAQMMHYPCAMTPASVPLRLQLRTRLAVLQLLLRSCCSCPCSWCRMRHCDLISAPRHGVCMCSNRPPVLITALHYVAMTAVGNAYIGLIVCLLESVTEMAALKGLRQMPEACYECCRRHQHCWHK